MIATYDQISGMLSEIGPILDLSEIAAYEDLQSWDIAVDDETGQLVTLHHDTDNHRLCMVGEVGPVNEDKLTETYSFLLQFNRFWDDNGGSRLALDDADGPVCLIVDVSLYELTTERLTAAIARFTELSRMLAAMIAEGIGETEAAPDATPPDPRDLMAQLA